MTRREVLFYAAFLIAMGAGWGITQPLTKIAVSTGYGHFGLVFWQLLIGAVLMGIICVVRRMALPLNVRALRLYLILAMVGTVLPNSLSYQAAVFLPAGIMSLLISTVPMFAFVIALMLGNDHFRWRRLIGLAFGFAGVLLIVAPAVDLGQDIPVGWAALYLIVALFYAFEGNYVNKWGTQGLGPFQVMLGASLVGLVVVTPLTLATGQFIMPGTPMPVTQMALLASSVIHVLVYASYVWLVGRAGAVFTVQVSYFVTGFGLIWASLILDETYAPTIWIALSAMFIGMYFVQPRPKVALAVDPAMGETGG